MKLSDRYHYTVLCEDAQMDTFIKAFLKSHGISLRRVTTIPIPAGTGCGEQHVRKRLPKEIKVLHSNNFLSMVLVVCIDADKYSYDEKKNFLIHTVRENEPAWDLKNEPLLLWIPKREIETWIAFFDDQDADEGMEYNHSGKPVRCKNEAYNMMLYCQGRYEGRTDMLPSIIKAKEEYERVCKLQKQRDA